MLLLHYKNIKPYALILKYLTFLDLYKYNILLHFIANLYLTLRCNFNFNIRNNHLYVKLNTKDQFSIYFLSTKE